MVIALTISVIQGIAMITERQSSTKIQAQSLHAASAGYSIGSVHSESAVHAKRAILKKTFEVGTATMVSRVLGMLRVFLQAQFLGVGVLSDAFVAAFAIPNRLRKVFAEGALSAAIIPTMVNVVRDEGKEQASRVMTLSCIVFEGILIALCMLIFCYASTVLYITAPGFSLEQIAYAVPYVRILVSLIIFISSSAVLTGALQAVNHFLVPACGPVLLNMFYIGGLIVGIVYKLSVETLCYCILMGGCVQFLLHVVMYWQLRFTFKRPDNHTYKHFRLIFVRFVPVLLSMSIMEINLSIDTAFASFLPAGSMTIIEYASRFMGIPLGVFGVAFATIMLPHFSRVIKQAPDQLGFYVREAAQLIFWVMASVAIAMSMCAEKIFITLFVSQKFSLAHALVAQSVLMAFLAGLFFFAFNKILLNVYYALGANSIPTFVSMIAIVLNVGFDVLGVYWFGPAGLALATTISSAVQMMLFVYFLHARFNINIELRKLVHMIVCMTLQIVFIMSITWLMHYMLIVCIQMVCSLMISHILLNTIAFWLWTGPLFAFAAYGLMATRKRFGVSLYFIDA
jgi:putative peptidoglycan lipid II flippase